jgi:hypothetical protein
VLVANALSGGSVENRSLCLGRWRAAAVPGPGLLNNPESSNYFLQKIKTEKNFTHRQILQTKVLPSSRLFPTTEIFSSESKIPIIFFNQC